ncbi:uncharacterized protein TRIADDRAFT_61337 [Trichoplax adhaerens]|uniref:FZ domain-containing protein n=1 Tax=Trichoplax adhaerens TaxID=10228 RepID=B3SAQ0_TRIAD|nr:predicted protein [Trichoplax adhaerens]EDV20141.1 predicted protein [Trichoplax adhaerens]|eukprot:XP_002117302.1 predicted protein [Trichoplax adhaerens]
MNASVPSYIVDTAAKQMNYIVDYMNTQTSKYTSACVTAARDIVCKGLLPQCSSDFRILSFLSTSKSCQSINSCPTGLFTAIGRTSAALCSLSGKQYSLTTCVNPAITNINSVHCHALPNITVPSWIVPVLKAQGNAINAQRLAYSLVGVEQSCTSQWTNFLCRSLVSCNHDQNRIISFGWSKEECTSSLKCLPAILKTSTEDQFDCNIFPSKSDSAGLSSHFSLIAATWLLAVWISE